jgi:hypothetical protein
MFNAIVEVYLSSYNSMLYDLPYNNGFHNAALLAYTKLIINHFDRTFI